MNTDKTRDYQHSDIDEPIRTTVYQGTNITITDDGAINSNGGGSQYRAGNGLNLSDTGEFSVDTNAIQTKLTAGYGIKIENGEISLDLESADTENY